MAKTRQTGSASTDDYHYRAHELKKTIKKQVESIKTLKQKLRQAKLLPRHFLNLLEEENTRLKEENVRLHQELLQKSELLQKEIDALQEIDNMVKDFSGKWIRTE
jgi:TPP-dependent pyruvate/acetoin dehydrogenase alpha subunit